MMRVLSWWALYLSSLPLVNGLGLRRSIARETESHLDSITASLQLQRKAVKTSYKGDCNGNCGMCEGDCDDDEDCVGSLKCFQRDKDEPLPPGCTGKTGSRSDYCYEEPDPTSGPTGGPSSAPSVVPTIMPSATPSVAVTSSPSSIPTIATPSTPSAVPTRTSSSAPTVPSSQPSSVSSVVPASAPVDTRAAPSPAPINPIPHRVDPTSAPISPSISPVLSIPTSVAPTDPLPMTLNTNIQCTGANGLDCLSLPRLDYQCSKGGPVNSLLLEYIGGSCSQSYNTQGPKANGIELNTPSSSQDARVVCRESSGPTLLDQIASEGDFLQLKGNPQLPDDLTCTISNPGAMLQEVLFDTSGSVDLFLLDRFCSLKVTGCDVTSCIMAETSFTFSIENTGGTPIKLTAIERDLGGSKRSLLALFILQHMSDSLLPGDTISVTETIQDINVCNPVHIDLKVEAQSTMGDREQAYNDSYDFSL